ncbi:MAG: hypothetical protein ACM3U2_03305 [Deltaproteobacteria bacterium]
MMIRTENSRMFAATGLLFWLAGAGPGAFAEDVPPPLKSLREQRVFGLTKVHQICLQQISAKDYAAMDPAGGGFPLGPGGRSPVRDA